MMKVVDVSKDPGVAQHIAALDDLERADAGEQDEIAADGGVLVGTEQQLNLFAAGALPARSVAHLRAGKVPVEGQFARGEVVRLEVTAVVTEVSFADMGDGTVRKHVLTPATIMRAHRGS